MDSHDGSLFEPPRPETPPSNGPALAPPSPGEPARLFVSPYDAPNATVVPTGSVGKRGKGKVIGGLIAVLALLGAGGFAITRIVAGNDSGAASPTEVGTRLMMHSPPKTCSVWSICCCPASAR